jgi:pectin methylesterase-like acyl-CoA thioesterase
MVNKTRRSKTGAKAFAAIMSVVLGLSNSSFAGVADVAFAETPDAGTGASAEAGDPDEAAGTASSTEESAGTGDSKEETAGTGTSEEEAAGTGSVSEDQKGNETEGGNSVTDTEDNEVQTDSATGEETSAEAVEESTADVEEEPSSVLEATAFGTYDPSDDGSQTSDRNFDYNKTDVWDFGAEDLGSNYNNRLDVATINGLYGDGVAAGSTNATIGKFSIDDGDFTFETSKTNNRIRSVNTDITRYDNKSLTANDGTVLSGYIYSNTPGDAVYLTVECQADDVLTFYVGSNANAATYYFENTQDSEDKQVGYFDPTVAKAQRLDFYPASTGKYKLYTTDEKLVVGRVYRSHAQYGTLSGTVEGFEGTGSFDLVFTNKKNGNEVRATVSDGQYSAVLAQGFDYELSLEGADEYVITSDKTAKISGDATLDVTVSAIDLAKVSGKVEIQYGDGIPEGFSDKLKLVFEPQDPDSVYEPQFEMEADGSFAVSVQKDVDYKLTAEDVDDYELLTTEFKASGDVDNAVISFIKKALIYINVEVLADGLTFEDLADSNFEFILLDEENEFADTAYSYTFTGKEIADEEAGLRAGQYRVVVTNVPSGYKFDETHSYDAIIREGVMETEYTVKVPFVSTKAPDKVPYTDVVRVGNDKDYATINDALEAIRNMDRTSDQKVTVMIDPGDYQEMLVIDTPNVTFRNATKGGSITPVNKGVSIASDSVRITGYYGHGYTYYSIGADCKYDAKLLKVNKHNGYPSFKNPGSGTTAGSYWNATVVVNAEGFEAYDIIFENSFNQYQSELAAKDVIVPVAGVKEGSAPRASMAAGDTAVQDKKYVERAAAMAIRAAAKETYFNHCAFIGRQDTLYGDVDSKEAYYNCDIYGGTDYIFGGMTAVFAKCNLIFNTSEDSNDKGFITAAQQKNAASRGYLMYNCTVTSTVPGENTASAYASKPGYLGRPWQANTSEVVYFYTVIDKTCSEYADVSESLIRPVAWDTGLGGKSERNVEYATVEKSGVDNSKARADWTIVKAAGEEAVTADGQPITVATFLGDWDPFATYGDDMTIVLPDASEIEVPEQEEQPASTTTEFVLESKDLTAFAKGAKADGDFEKAGTEKYFTILYSASSKIDSSSKTWEDGYASDQRINLGGKPVVANGEVTANAVKFTTSNSATVKVWWAANKDNYQMALLDSTGNKITATSDATAANATYISSLKVDNAGTYYIAGDEVNNYIFKIMVTEDKVAAPVVYDFESQKLEAVPTASAANAGVVVKAGTDNYFSLLYSEKTKVDASSKTWEDGYTSPQRLNFGGKVTTEANAVKFTTSSEATVKIWWVEGGDDNRQMAIIDGNGTTVAVTEGTWKKNDPFYSELKLTQAGTYYLGGLTGNNNIYRVQVVDGAPVAEVRPDWSAVAAPEIKSVQLNAADNGKIDVTVSAAVGKNGGDSVAVTMYDAEGKEIGSARSLAEKDEHTLPFEPSKSGAYSFKATLARDDEESVKESEASAAISFVLPLETPKFKNLVNRGDGTVKANFYSVPEATSYLLYATDKTDAAAKMFKNAYTPSEVTDNSSTEYSVQFLGLTVGHEYEITVQALRDREENGQAITDTSETSAARITVSADSEQEWVFSAFGSSVNNKSSDNGYKKNSNGSVTVWSQNGKGKLVPASTDGLAFYYTAIPADQNFTLTATVTVDQWTFSNAQEGFGIMAADRVGINGDAGAFWNNSYMASVTKVEYLFDPAAGALTDDPGAAKVTMKLGVGSQEKVGVTAENLETILGGDVTPFSSKMTTLETGMGAKGAGTYNIVGNYTNTNADFTNTCADNLTTTFRLSIRKNNTGYFVTYLDESGDVIGQKKYYDTKALEQIDKDNVYVGFFASRNATATFSDVSLTTIDPADDEAAEGRDITYVTPSYSIISATYSNTAKYAIQFYGNADGVLTITDEKGNKIIDARQVKAGVVEEAVTKLVKGDNNFKVNFVPDADFHPENDEYQLLASYAEANFTHTVKYATINDSDKIYVSASGKATGAGTEADPVDIYTAVKYVQPGQTILLAAGNYDLKGTVKVERGISGTPDKPIKMVTSGGRAIFDFGGKSAGFIFAGDYWYVNGIDCTRSANGQKGIQVSGSHITLEDVRTYFNGNTGIQVSRYLTSDGWDQWPSYDLILNCTSYGNADAGYEDADGFAAKLTVAEGIVFDGCIAYNNADDGWDLFAKVETGHIGQVTIRNSVAFANGFGVDGTNEGNGNGFKMGGSSITGHHILVNSVAWGNKAKGIDSNSCPDIIVNSSMSFNNGGSNVALYTNDVPNTDFEVNGVISYRTENKGTDENLKLKGTQDKNKVYGSRNFFWTGSESANNSGLKVTDDWFVSLDAPYANANDPYAVAAGMRTADGSIDLGDFLKLTAKGQEALAGAGLNAADVAAELGGSYTAITDERDIAGSEADADKDKETEEDDNNGGNSGSGNGGNGSGSGSGSGNSGSGSGSGNSGSGSTSGSGSSDSGSGSSDSGSSAGTESGSSESGSTGGSTSSQTGASTGSTTEAGAATGSTSQSGTTTGGTTGNTGNAGNTGNTGSTGNTGAGTTTGTNTETTTGNTSDNNDSAVAGASREESTSSEGTTDAGETTEGTTTDGTTADGTQNIEDGQTPTTDKPERPVPVLPIAAGVVVVIAAVVISIKAGLFAKLLALLHIR